MDGGEAGYEALRKCDEDRPVDDGEGGDGTSGQPAREAVGDDRDAESHRRPGAVEPAAAEGHAPPPVEDAGVDQCGEHERTEQRESGERPALGDEEQAGEPDGQYRVPRQQPVTPREQDVDHV